MAAPNYYNPSRFPASIRQKTLSEQARQFDLQQGVQAALLEENGLGFIG